MKKFPKDAFFEKMEALGLALTFDDVRLKSGHSEVMPDNVNLESKFSKNIFLKIPLVSADMDTVTESGMAIGMALLGGLGVIHKNLSPKDQADEVARVKYYLNGFIDEPICAYENESVREILMKKEEKKYDFCTFPVINRANRLIGILSKTDFDFCQDFSLPVAKVMSKKIITAPKGTSLKEAHKIMMATKKKILPLLDKNGKIAGMYVFKDVQRIIMKNPTGCNVDKNGQLIVAAAVGVNDFERIDLLVKNKVNVLVISTAHADTKSVIETLKEIKRNYKIDVVVGNVSEPESACRLAKAGADGVKVGQGPGSICTTRVIAGIGSPQVSAVYKCAKAIGAFDIPVCADGGLHNSGDIPIAIGAGACSVMMGGMLAGTKEAPGEIVFKDGRQWKVYRGMGSIGAMEVNKGSRERYRQVDTGKKELIAEGVEGLKPYKGELEQVIFQYLGGLKRGMGYVGAANISELHEKADFIRITQAGKTESHPHDIIITKEPPNYSLE
ncbi:MAG: IMP dehydrogenase [Patescibacteria group bacterium]|nr:IMP dehydrogenase [Patescibacteria group bacterium]MDD5164704.1 IMP dehydrogenase [Patescibacteria group bacterium]MDD5534180.1 IMP dehydrogenase [Patescibacteria group bacterium]